MTGDGDARAEITTAPGAGPFAGSQPTRLVGTDRRCHDAATSSCPEAARYRAPSDTDPSCA
jgi:hypothetical protein